MNYQAVNGMQSAGASFGVTGQANAQVTAMIVIALAVIVVLSHWGLR